MPQVWLLLKGAEQTSQTVPIRTQLFEEPGSSYIKTRLDHQSHDAIESAELATNLTYRILRSEGYLTQSTVVRYRLQDAPENITGHSGGLAFALSFATKALHRQHFKPVAASGILEEQGGVTRVEGFLEKLQTALAILPPNSQLLYPEGNADDIDQTVHQQAKAGQVELIAVNNLEEAFARIGIQLKKVYTYAPYRGLEAFQFQHAGTFFGRSNEVRALCQQLDERAETHHPSILVLGASGSGKSSLVLAGVLPELVRGTTWRSNIQTLWSVFRPRDAQAIQNNPLSTQPELERLFQGVMTSWQQALTLNGAPDPQTREAKTLIAWLDEAVKNYPKTNTQQETRFVWVIDQLEELFTLGFQPDTIHQFTKFLVERAQGGIRLILTLRSDYYPHYQSQPALLNHFRENGTFDLLPIEGEAIEQIIREPAWVSDSQFERDAAHVSLASKIQRDAGNQPGILPLLEFALTELYQGRDKQQRLFTYQAYESMGGLKGSIGHRTETLYQALDKESKKAIPSLIRGLSFVANEGKGVTARPVPLDNYPEATVKRAVIDRMTEARLLIKEGNENTQVQVRVAHEALLTHWERAKQQIEKERRDLALMRRLEEQSQRWQTTEAKSQTSLLLHAGLPLTEAVDLIERFGEDLPVEVKNYIQASQQAEQTRTATENRKRKLRSRLRNLAVIMISAVALVAGWQWQIAEKQKNIAIARFLATNSLTSLTTKNADVFLKGSLLVAESLRRAQTSQGTIAWEKFLDHIPPLSTSISNQPLSRTIDFSPLGDTVAIIDRKGIVILTDPNTGKVITTFNAKKAGMNENQTLGVLNYYAKLKYSPNGKLLSTANIEQGASLGTTIKLREISSGKLIIDIPQVDVVSEMIFSPDGSQLATAISGEVIMWDTSTGSEVFRYRHMRNSSYEGLKFAYSSDGKLLAVSSFYDTRILDMLSGAELFKIDFLGIKSLSWSSDGKLLALSNGKKTEVWDISTGKKQTEFKSKGWSKVDFIPNSTQLVAGNSKINSGIVIRDALTGKIIYEVSGSGIGSYAISPDGSLLVVELSSLGSDIQVINLTNGKKVFSYYTENVGAISFNHDGSRFATVGYVQGAKIWHFTESLFEYSAKNALNDVVFTSDGLKVITALNENVIIWDAISGNKIDQITIPSGVEKLIVEPNDHWFLTWSKDKTVRIWSLETGKEISKFKPQKVFGKSPFLSLKGSNIGFSISHYGENGREFAYQFWDSMTGKQLSKIPKKGWSNQIRMVSANNGHIVTFDKDFIRLWDIDYLHEIQRLNNLVTDDNYKISPNGNYFVFTEQYDNHAELWSLVKGRKIASLINKKDKQQSDRYPMLYQFSSDEKLVSFIDERAGASTTDEDYNSLNLHKTASGEQIFRFTPKKLKEGSDQLIRNVHFSPNNQYMVAVLSSLDTMSGSILVWDTSDGQQIGQLGIPGMYSRGFLEFSPNSKYLARSGDEGIRIWDIEAKTPLFESINYGGPVTFGPNGRWLVAYNKKTENGASTKRLLLWQQKDLIEKLCERIGRNFSEQEWQQFLGEEPFRPTCDKLG